MAIYTKKGDKGETSLATGERVSKDSLRIEAIGAIDEVNSFLGTIFPKEKRIINILKAVQKDLFTFGAILAGTSLSFPRSKAKKLERVIDDLEGRLPVLKNFILPRGTPEASKLFFARALVRRAERRLAALAKEEKIKSNLSPYLNRLSDALFMLGRWENFKLGVKEEVWKRGSGEKDTS